LYLGLLNFQRVLNPFRHLPHRKLDISDLCQVEGHSTTNTFAAGAGNLDDDIDQAKRRKTSIASRLYFS